MNNSLAEVHFLKTHPVYEHWYPVFAVMIGTTLNIYADVTKEALLHGTEQFFMDDTSRNGEAHYGIGLFFAKTVAEKYGGGIKLSSSENTGGARVEIFFLSSQETR